MHNKTNAQYARIRSSERQSDVRQKIQLGGLVKKAGLENETTAVLYGIFINAFETLSAPGGEDARREWQLKGDVAFRLENRANHIHDD